MKKNILDFLNTLEGYKSACQNIHWNADSLSQHELFDKIKDTISDFQDKVSEVEQSMHGHLPLNSLKGTEYKVTDLQKFVNDVISSARAFYKTLEGDEYIGMRSDCESFLSDMQRNSYLLQFTIKEDMVRRIKSRVDEARPKNVPLDDSFDKFNGRKPQSMKGRINKIYKLVSHYGLDSRRYNDDHWQAIEDYYKVISSLGCDVSLKPCADLSHADGIESDGGYCDYDEEDNMPRSKQYSITITFDDGMRIDGYVKCMACGTMSDPFSAYDTCMVLWPKSASKLSEIRLSESELKLVLENAVKEVLSNGFKNTL